MTKPPPESIQQQLFTREPGEYGLEYDSHLLEQYKLFLEMADRISNRRQSAHSFFLGLHAALVALAGYFQGTPGNWLALYICVAGTFLCYWWYRLVLSYKQLNTGKFLVIHQIEQRLPSAPYDAEWEALGRGNDPKLYLPFTTIELRVPWVFFGLYMLIIGITAWQFLSNYLTQL